ncbi:unnamed protein product [Orchesella dallaii]|uniref:Uncharacterized protein n=1 Tax=Orchesella dallaii TaxID=48710 RepID=A0ABP1S6G1_9HEXA
MSVRQSLFFVLIIAVVIVSAKRNKKEGNKDSNPGQAKKGILNLSSCLGEPVTLNIASTEVEACLTAKYDEIIATFGNSTDEKSAKKLAKKKQKLNKKLKKKCMAECEWKVLGLIPEGKPAGNASSTSNSDGGEKFTKMFPEAARETIKTAIAMCLNTEPTVGNSEEEIFNKANQMCSQNKKITKCFQKSLKRACKGKPASGTTTTSVPAVGIDATGKSATANSPTGVSTSSPLVPTMAPPPPASTGDVNDEEEKDDDDDDDDMDNDDDEDNELTTKRAPASLSLNTAKPVTK